MHIYEYVNMPDVAANYEKLLDFITNFAHNWRIFMFDVLYIHHINCVVDKYEKFNIMTCYSDVSASYESLNDFFLTFLSIFMNFLTTIHVWSVATSPNFHRLCV